MSEIEEPSALSPMAWRTNSQHGMAGEYPGNRADRRGGERRRHQPYADASSHSAEVTDAVELFGVETQDLGPQMRDMLMRVAGEIETLKEELERATHREHFLDQQAHLHPLLPVLHARAFQTHLEGVIRAREVAGVPASAVLFYLDNHDDLRRRFGLKAADACLELLLKQVQGAVRTTDLIGAVGPAGLVVLFYPADRDGVRRKVQGVVNSTAHLSMPWGGASLPLTVVAGMWDLAIGDTADRIMEELDQQVRRPWR